MEDRAVNYRRREGETKKSPVVHSLQGIKKKGWQKREPRERSNRSELRSIQSDSICSKVYCERMS
jgi:hypothetical protein